MIGRAATVAFLLLIGTSPAFADAASEAMLRSFLQWVDSSPDWSASASLIRSDGSDTVAEGVVFTRHDPAVSVSIESITLKDLQERADGGFTASAIELKAAGLVTDSFDSTVPSASVLDVSMPSFAGVSIDPQHVMTSIAHFYSLMVDGSLKNLQIPLITVTEHVDVPGSAPIRSVIAYRNFSTTGLSKGVLDHQEIGPVSVISSGTPNGPVNFEIDKIETDRIDIGAWAHVLDPAQYTDGHGDGVWRPVMAHAAYHGLKSSAGGAVFKLDEVAVENVDGRQTDKPFAAAWDRLMDPSLSHDTDLALEAVTSMLAAWRVGTVRYAGMALQMPKENVTFSLDNISLTGWSNAGFDSFILKSMRGSGPEGFLSLNSLEIAGFVSPDLKALVRFAAIDKTLPPEEHAQAIADSFAALPRIGHLALANFVAGKSQAESVSLDGLSVDLRDWNRYFAGSTDIHVDGLKIPRQLLKLDAQAAQIYDTLGYDDLIFSMSVSDRWSPETGIDDATWSLSWANAADMTLTYELSGLTSDWLSKATAAAAKGEDSQAAVMAMLADLSLTHATLSVTDRSLLDRGFKVVAEKQGLTVDGATYREQMRAALPFIISAAAPADIAKLVTEPLQAFMAGGQQLLAKIAPPTPLGLLDLMAAAQNPMALPEKLNLSLQSEAPAN